MEKKFITTTVNKTQLEALLKNVGKSNLVTLGIEVDHINGDKLLWVSNAEFGGDRKVVLAL